MTAGQKGVIIQQELQTDFTQFANQVTEEGLGKHEVEIEFRYDPAQRLRYYQFDPFHHGVAIWSVH
jgi:hypothetical protein